jgi:hypothetical protein
MPSYQIVCPSCGRALQSPEDLTGQQVECAACNHLFVVAPAPHSRPAVTAEEDIPFATAEEDVPYATAEQDPPRPRRRRYREDDDYVPSRDTFTNRLNTRINSFVWTMRWPLGIGGVLFLVVGGLALYFLLNTVTVYVDNGGREPLEVYFDGSHQGTVQPGTVLRVGCRHGPRHVRVMKGGQALLDEVKHLDGGFFGKGKYILNPGRENFYWHYRAEYATSHTAFRPQAFEPPPGQPRDVRAEFSILANQVNVRKAEPWLDVTGNDHVLEPPPRTVQVRGSERVHRDVVLRLPPADGQVLWQARQNQNPTDQDLNKLAEAVDRTLRSAP